MQRVTSTSVVFTTPALAALRRHFGTASITYLVEPAGAAVLAGNPHIDELIVVPTATGLEGVRAFWGLIRHLRPQRFDLAIDFAEEEPRLDLAAADRIR